MLASRVVVELEGRTSQHDARVAASATNFERNMGRIRRSAGLTEAAVGGSFAGIIKGFATIQTARLAVQLIDASTRITNSLKIAGLAGEELKAVYDSLFESAQRNAAPLESLAELYGKAALAQKQLNASSEDLLRFTENTALALRVSGKSAQESAGALLQLGQAIGGAVVRAEEFNSIQEGAPAILMAVAAGLKEAGGSVATLRALVIDGKVSSEAFFRAFEAGAQVLRDKVAGAELTVSQQFTRLQNVLIDVAGKFNESSGAGKAMGDALEGLGTDIQNFYTFLEGIAGPMSEFIGQIQGGITAINNFAAAFPKIPALEKMGFDSALASNKIMGTENSSTLGGRVLTQSFEIIGATPGDQALIDAMKGKEGPAAIEPVAVPVEPVTLGDYPITGTGGTGGAGKKSPAQNFAENLKRVEDMTMALDLETAAVGRGTYEKERALKIEELLVDAREAGVQIGAAERAAIDETADAYARAVEALEKTNVAQQRYIEGMKEFESLTATTLKGFVSDLRDGVDAGEALGNVFDSLADKLIDIAINNLVGAAFGMLLGGGVGGGGVGSLIGGLFGGFKAGGGPVQSGKAYAVGEQGPELFVPNTSGVIVPNNKIGGSAGSGDYIRVYARTEVVNGNLVPLVTEVSGQVGGRLIQGYDDNLFSRMSEKNRREGG